MKNNLKFFFLFALILVLVSCSKHEVTPSPLPQKAIALFIEKNNSTSLWYIETDGGSFGQVLPDSIGTNINNPAWSSDGRTIFFIKTSARKGENGLYSIKPSGKDYKAVYKDSDNQLRNFYQLTSSSDNQHIIFSLDIVRTGRKVIEIYRMCPCGQSVHRLTQFEIPNAGQPVSTEAYAGSFAPGDSLLVFAQGNPIVTGRKPVHIFNINVNTKEQKLLRTIMANDVVACTPSYSPDGKKLLLSIDGFIYKMDADGSNLTKVGNQKGFRPTWDKNGKDFYFSGNDIPGVQAGLYKADVNLTFVEKVIKNNFFGNVGGFSVNAVK